MNDKTLEEKAKELFDKGPFNHPAGRIPQWENQPEHIKDVFRNKVKN